MISQVRVGASSADDQLLRSAFNAAQFRQSPKADQLPRWKSPGAVLHHQFGAAGNRQPDSRFLRKQLQHRVQFAGRHELVLGWKGSHLELPAASETASKMR